MSQFSVLTNVGAQIALQSLTSPNKALDTTQQRITTGLKVNGPTDDAASYTIAQNMRGTLSGNDAVKTALANGDSVVNTAIQAGQSVSDLLTEMKAKVVQANQAGLDSSSRSALQNDFDALRQQIATIVSSASFNNTNLIDTSASTLTVLSTQDGSVITVSAQKLDTTTLGIDQSDLTSSANAATALTAINTAIQTAANKLAALGSAANWEIVNTPGATNSAVQIIAHDNVLKRMTKTPVVAWPSETFVGREKEFFFNGEPVFMYHVPAAHTDGDSIVFFRRSDVIATGDVFRTDSYPVIDLENGGSVEGIIEALNLVLDLAVPAHHEEGGTFIVPGHGRICDEFDVLEYRDMVTIVRDRVKAMKKKGMTLDQVRAARPTLDYDSRYGATTGAWTTDRFVEAVYRGVK